MPDATALSTKEIAEFRRLLEVEKIRKVGQLYSQYLDAREIDRLAELYTEDASGEWGPYGNFAGRENIRAALRAAYATREPFDGLHVTTNHWIELTGPDTAQSRCYLADTVLVDKPGPMDHPGFPTNPVLLYALYENEYRKVGTQWQIARSVIQFLWSKRLTQGDFPEIIEASPIG